MKHLLSFVLVTVKIVAEQSYDSFILQIRGRRDETGNVTYPGKWIKIPHIAHQIDCGRKRGVAVIDKGFLQFFTLLMGSKLFF